MQINLIQQEIQEALTEYISNQGFDVSNKDVIVTMIAGRGSKGHSANIEILPKGEAAKRTKGKGKAAKAEAVVETDAPEADEPAIDFNDD